MLQHYWVLTIEGEGAQELDYCGNNLEKALKEAKNRLQNGEWEGEPAEIPYWLERDGEHMGSWTFPVS